MIVTPKNLPLDCGVEQLVACQPHKLEVMGSSPISATKITIMEKVKLFNYEIVKEIPIERVSCFSEHRRLRVFHIKGTICVSCGIEGTRLIRGRDKKGNYHWDVYTKDLLPITVDHILPVSKGGTNDLFNLQPMCSSCNSKKGNGDNMTLGIGACCKWPRSKRNKNRK